MKELAAGQSLRAMDEMDLPSDFELRGALDRRPDDGLHRPRGQGRLDRHEGPLFQVPTEAREGGLEGLEGGIMGRRFDRGLDAHRHDVGAGDLGHVEGGSKVPLRRLSGHELREARFAPLEWTPPRIDRIDLPRVDVDPDDLGAGRGHRRGERDADVAQANHGDLHVRADARVSDKGFNRGAVRDDEVSRTSEFAPAWRAARQNAYRSLDPCDGP